MRVRYSSAAANDLSQILDYLASANPVAARRLLARFESTVRQISQFPQMGRPTTRPNIRRAVVGNYLMVYELGIDEVIIQFVRHGSRKRPWEND